MTTTAVEVAPLTVQDIKALRTAETVVFRHYKGVPTIEVYLRDHTEPLIYTAVQQRLFPEPGVDERKRTLAVGGLITYYDDDSRKTAGPEGNAFEMIHSAQYSQTWKTITSLLKVGDVLTLHFNGDRYSNGYSKKAYLHIDGLNLDIKRGKAQLSFMVAVGVCLANSARMVKPNGF
jgi:hypothetical protein